MESTTVRRTPSKSRKTAPSKPSASHGLLVVGDLLMTCFWVFLSSVFAEVAEALAALSGFQEFGLAIIVTIVAVMAVGPLCDAFGGALVNPTHNLAFIAAGKSSVGVNTMRMGAQIAGALAGSYAAVHTLPSWLQDHFHKLPGGLADGVDMSVGFVAEAGLSAVLNSVVLYSLDTPNKRAAYWSPIAATVVLLVAGSYYTGPGVNPAISFSWYHHYQGLDLEQHLWLYWAAPFVGALTAGLAYRLAGSKPAAAAAAKPAAKTPAKAKKKPAASPQKQAKQAQGKGTKSKEAKED